MRLVWVVWYVDLWSVLLFMVVLRFIACCRLYVWILWLLWVIGGLWLCVLIAYLYFGLLFCWGWLLWVFCLFILFDCWLAGYLVVVIVDCWLFWFEVLVLGGYGYVLVCVLIYLLLWVFGMLLTWVCLLVLLGLYWCWLFVFYFGYLLFCFVGWFGLPSFGVCICFDCCFSCLLIAWVWVGYIWHHLFAVCLLWWLWAYVVLDCLLLVFVFTLIAVLATYWFLEFGAFTYDIIYLWFVCCGGCRVRMWFWFAIWFGRFVVWC